MFFFTGSHLREMSWCPLTAAKDFLCFGEVVLWTGICVWPPEVAIFPSGKAHLNAQFWKTVLEETLLLLGHRSKAEYWGKAIDTSIPEEWSGAIGIAIFLPLHFTLSLAHDTIEFDAVVLGWYLMGDSSKQCSHTTFAYTWYLPWFMVAWEIWEVIINVLAWSGALRSVHFVAMLFY